MNDTRISEAMARIENSLARIERAAARAPADSSSSAQLVTRHEALREQVSISLMQLDSLIDRLET